MKKSSMIQWRREYKEKISTFLPTESESRFHSVIKLELHTVRYKPVRGETYIPLPKELDD